MKMVLPHRILIWHTQGSPSYLEPGAQTHARFLLFQPWPCCVPRGPGPPGPSIGASVRAALPFVLFFSLTASLLGITRPASFSPLSAPSLDLSHSRPSA